jgi:hypothetical protein
MMMGHICHLPLYRSFSKESFIYTTMMNTLEKKEKYIAHLFFSLCIREEDKFHQADSYTNISCALHTIKGTIRYLSRHAQPLRHDIGCENIQKKCHLYMYNVLKHDYVIIKKKCENDTIRGTQIFNYHTS